MCGAVAFAANPHALDTLDMNAMVKSMHHRGPNGNSTFEAPGTSHRLCCAHRPTLVSQVSPLSNISMLSS